jgi:tRNA(fMet)-specific endonuclease VapC
VNRRYMLDTNTVSYIIKGKSAASRKKLAELRHGEIACISVITEGEILYGLAKNPNATVLRAAVEGFFAKIQILPWGREEATAYGDLRASQEAAGKPLGSLDMLIAAHAISVGAVLVTSDTAFLGVRALAGAAVNWAKDV